MGVSPSRLREDQEKEAGTKVGPSTGRETRAGVRGLPVTSESKMYQQFPSSGDTEISLKKRCSLGMT